MRATSSWRRRLFGFVAVAMAWAVGAWLLYVGALAVTRGTDWAGGVTIASSVVFMLCGLAWWPSPRRPW